MIKQMLRVAVAHLRVQKAVLLENALNTAAIIFYILSELESLNSNTNNRAILRRLFLKAKGVCAKGNVFIGYGFKLYKTKYHRLTIGKNAAIGESAGIYIHNDIFIGSNFMAGPGLTINNGSHCIENLEPNASKLVIGNDVWCAVNVTIIKGAAIGDGCVIGANSLVNSHIPPNSLAFGIPARVIRTIHRKDDLILWNCFDK